MNDIEEITTRSQPDMGPNMAEDVAGVIVATSQFYADEVLSKLDTLMVRPTLLM